MMDGIEALEAYDNFADARNRLREMSDNGKFPTWAGIPMPIEGDDLVIEPKYPLAEVFKRAPESVTDDEFKVRSTFWSTRYKRTVFTYEEDGKVRKVMLPGENAFNMALRTASISQVWGIEQETRAVQLLGTLVRHHMFKSYMLTGMLIETSERSGVTYIFRRLRPTIALRATDDEVRYLAALCMHPIGYYADSWAGAMCPTDEVIAHLMMMRADEPMYWRRANQHAKHRPEAGL